MYIYIITFFFPSFFLPFFCPPHRISWRKEQSIDERMEIGSTSNMQRLALLRGARCGVAENVTLAVQVRRLHTYAHTRTHTHTHKHTHTNAPVPPKSQTRALVCVRMRTRAHSCRHATHTHTLEYAQCTHM